MTAAIFAPPVRAASHLVTWRLTVQLHELELTVGDVLQIGEYTVTVLDIENGEVTFRVEEPEHGEDSGESSSILRPR
jgi:hypothetical protein